MRIFAESTPVNRIVGKLTTKPVWWWERKRRYAIRNGYDRLPPLKVCPEGTRFVVLTTPQSANDALWAAWSWYRFLQPHGFVLHLAVDGELDARRQIEAQTLFPGISIYNVNSITTDLCERRPSLRRFLDHHPVSQQIGLILSLSCRGPLLYSDHDVVAFNPPIELMDFIQRKVPCYFLDCEGGCHDPSLLKVASDMRLDSIRRLNAGFIYIPQDALSADLAERILAGWSPLPFFYYTPQTLMSILMREADAQPLPESRYVISNRRQFYREQDVNYEAIAARHFTGTVRHVLYRNGMPILLKQSGTGVAEMQGKAGKRS